MVRFVLAEDRHNWFYYGIWGRLNNPLIIFSLDLPQSQTCKTWVLKCSYRFEIWHATRQQCCWAARQISERLGLNINLIHWIYKTFKSLLIGYWNDPLFSLKPSHHTTTEFMYFRTHSLCFEISGTGFNYINAISTGIPTVYKRGSSVSSLWRMRFSKLVIQHHVDDLEQDFTSNALDIHQSRTELSIKWDFLYWYYSIFILMAYSKTVACPLRIHWTYQSLAESHQYEKKKRLIHVCSMVLSNQYWYCGEIRFSLPQKWSDRTKSFVLTRL